MTVPVKTQGVDVEVIVDVVSVRVGRALALPIFLDVLTPFDENLREDLTGKMVRRLSAQMS